MQVALCSNLDGESNWALSCEVVVISYLIFDFMITSSNYVAVVKLRAMLKYVLHRAENHNLVTLVVLLQTLGVLFQLMTRSLLQSFTQELVTSTINVRYH